MKFIIEIFMIFVMTQMNPTFAADEPGKAPACWEITFVPFVVIENNAQQLQFKLLLKEYKIWKNYDL